MMGLGLPTLATIVIVVLFLYSAVKILNEYERGVIFRLGRVIGAKGPGPTFDAQVHLWFDRGAAGWWPNEFECEEI